MLTRTIALFTFGLAALLVGAAQTDAQPGPKSPFGKGPGKGPGPGPGSEIQKLEKDLERLMDQVQEAKATLARAKEAGKGKGAFEGKGKGKSGFDGKGKGGDFKKKFEPKKEFTKPGVPPADGAKGQGKLDPETIKTRYEFYKKLYDELPKSKSKGFEGKGGFGPKGFEGKKKEPMPSTGKGSRGPGTGGVEARIDRLIRELEELRSEVRGGKKK